MPVAGQRDPEETRLKLVNWLARQMPEARDVAVPELTIPQSSGFSNETFLFDATWTDADGSQRAELVLRAQPQEYGLFPNIDVLSQQYRTLALLHEHTDVPVPRVRWPEPDAAVLGQPFFVMDRVRGDVPGDAPPYTTSGFLVDLPPEGRRALHEDALDVMTRIHLVDWRSIGFDHLDRKQFGPLGSGQLRGFFEHYYGSLAMIYILWYTAITLLLATQADGFSPSGVLGRVPAMLQGEFQWSVHFPFLVALFFPLVVLPPLGIRMFGQRDF